MLLSNQLSTICQIINCGAGSIRIVGALGTKSELDYGA